MHSETKSIAETVDTLISLLVPVKAGESGIDLAIEQLDAFFAHHVNDRYEIIIVLNGLGADEQIAELATAFRTRSHIRLLGLREPGKGRALKHGFQAALGRWIFFTDADLPYDLRFFLDAIPHLRDGYDFVTGNRRLPDSTFTVPTALLPLVFKRHRLGIYFNQIVARFFLGLTCGDTQAGIKAMSHRFASIAFSRQLSQGFLADLEFHLVCLQNNFKHCELPIHFHLRNEKSTVQLSKQFFETLFWIPRFAFARFSGFYRLQQSSPIRRLGLWNRILKFAWGRHANVIFFLVLRWVLTPYSAMERRLPRSGKVLDLGCGHGLMATLMALVSTERTVEGWDHDAKRISIADKLGGSLSNLSFKKAGLLDPIPESFKAITMIDVLHYFSEAEQEQALARAWQALQPGGVLIFREIDPDAGLKGKLNRLYEKFATLTGFTKSQNAKVQLRTREAWKTLAASCGFQVFDEKCSSFLFADILFICHKSTAAAQGPVPWQTTADDWGLSPGVNQGILDLARAGVIRRVSVMADGPAIQDQLHELQALTTVELGLHFSLTDSQRFRSPLDFLRYCSNPFRARSQKIKLIESEFERQVKILQGHGIHPLYLDGHHHVHVFPLVASCLANSALAQKTVSTVRIPLDDDVWQARKFVIGVLARRARRAYGKQGWKTKPFYYPMGIELLNPLSLAERLTNLDPATEVIFHPARRNDLVEIGSTDPYREMRVQEYETLRQLPAVLAYKRDLAEPSRTRSPDLTTQFVLT